MADFDSFVVYFVYGSMLLIRRYCYIITCVYIKGYSVKKRNICLNIFCGLFCRGRGGEIKKLQQQLILYQSDKKFIHLDRSQQFEDIGDDLISYKTQMILLVKRLSFVILQSTGVSELTSGISEMVNIVKKDILSPISGLVAW